MPDLIAFAFIDPAVNILLMDVITKPISYPEPSYGACSTEAKGSGKDWF